MMSAVQQRGLRDAPYAASQPRAQYAAPTERMYNHLHRQVREARGCDGMYVVKIRTQAKYEDPLRLFEDIAVRTPLGLMQPCGVEGIASADVWLLFQAESE